MAQIVLNIPNEHANRAVDALCVLGRYAGDPDDVPARREFARGVAAQLIRDAVLQVERTQLANAATTQPVLYPVDVT